MKQGIIKLSQVIKQLSTVDQIWMNDRNKDSTVILALSLSKKLQCKSMWMCHLKWPTIIETIRNILNIDGNKIQSIEKLIFLNAPQLMILNLWKNRITNIGSLRKCNFPELRSFSINGNFIQEFDSLCQLAMGKFMCKQQFNYILDRDVRKKMRNKGIIIQSQDEENSRINGQNLAWILKIPLQVISTLFIMNQQRINQENIISQIRRKYQGIDIYKKGWQYDFL